MHKRIVHTYIYIHAYDSIFSRPHALRTREIYVGGVGFFFVNPHPRTFFPLNFRGRKGGREENKRGRETETSM